MANGATYSTVYIALWMLMEFFFKFKVDEIDWAPLNELPAVPVKEVTSDYVKAKLPFLTLYTPSGKNYHIFTTDTNASIGRSYLSITSIYLNNVNVDRRVRLILKRSLLFVAVEKGVTNSQSLYISYFYPDGRKFHIHFVPGSDPYFGISMSN